MSAIQWVRCPNCGDFAERQLLSDRQAVGCDHVIQTACAACDYLMIMGFPAGRVLEAYAPGQASFAQPSSELDISRWKESQASIATRIERAVQPLHYSCSRTF